MAAIAMDTGRVLVVHDPNCLYTGLPSFYTLVGDIDVGQEWMVARSVLHRSWVPGADRPDIPVAETEDPRPERKKA